MSAVEFDVRRIDMDRLQKETIKNNLENLINRYNATLRNRPHSEISEETIRTWLNELLLVFGWDVQNTNHVLQERVLQGTYSNRLREIHSPHRKPDYILLNGANIKTFVDAKSLDIDIFASDDTAYQIRSYGWSAKTPCAFVSNFEQFVIYDTRFVPQPNQPASLGTIQFGIDSYLDNFETLFDHLWHDNVCSNKLEELYQVTAIDGRNQVDAQFMSVLSDFRRELAENLFVQNNNIIVDDTLLNYYTQVILDRIVFIRVCESKGIETQEKLRNFTQADEGFWKAFKTSCYMEFYTHYDGAMFSRDESFQCLQLNDDILTSFIEKLYYPYPYRFDVIPVKVIANIYEEFLGKQLIISNGHISEVTKEEYVRTNGAVATPEHIVDMICKQTIDLTGINTIDELLKVKILDPCCGSGVFMVSCYELISKKMVQLLENNEEQQLAYPHFFFVCDGQMLLTISARRAVVTNCLYGIDCDEAAIEVTKMSLALKIVDGNNPLAWEGIGAFGDRVLREIAQNIKLGNTLVDTDGHFGANQILDIKPFNVKGTFESVFSTYGGFSYIVGNPPYVETKHYKAAQPAMHDYLRERYSSFEGKADLAVLFIERSMQLLNRSGKLGFIIQRRWFKTDYGRPTRRLINDGKYLERLIDFKATDIFKGRMVYASVLILNKAPSETLEYYFMPATAERIKTLFENSTLSGEFAGCEYSIIPAQEGSENWNFEQYEITQLVEKYTDIWNTFAQYPRLKIKDGIQVLWKKVYHLQDVHFENDVAIGRNGFGEIARIEKDFVRGVVYNREFYPFKKVEPEAYCLFPYEGSSNNAILFSEVRERFPLAYSYLVANEERIKNKVAHRDGDLWHTFTREHNHALYSVDKIIVPMTARDTIATYMPNSDLYMDNANVWFIYIPGASPEIMKSITCIINSTIFSVFGKSGANPQAGGYYKFNKQFLAPIPFPSSKIVLSPEIQRLAGLHDEISQIQENYLRSTPGRKEILAESLKHLWAEVDSICYSLYGVTDGEKELIESIGRTISRVDLLGGAI